MSTHATRPRTSMRTFVIVGFIVALLVAGGVSLFASSHPDGLEYVAEDVGFSDTAEDSAVADSPVADYSAQAVVDEAASTSLAGILGVAVTAAAAFGLFALLRRRE